MEKNCFVIMPFTEKLNGVYSKLKSICNDLNVNCIRSDENSIGSITKGIFECIYKSDIIIADLTFSNPNVYYELAISHCIGRKTILITQEDKNPFDISQDYIIKYTNTMDGGVILENHIKRILKYILNGGVIDNPAQMFLPKSLEEKRIDKLSDLSKEILIALAESRKMEIEVVIEKAFLMSDESVEKVKKDLAKLDELISKIKNQR